MPASQRDITGYCIVILCSLAFLLWLIPGNMPEHPGYGIPASLLPSVAALCMLALALAGLFRCYLTLRKDSQTDKSRLFLPAHPLHLPVFILPCALLMPAMSHAGFIPAGIAFMIIIQLACRQRRPLILVAVAVAPVLAVYATMRFALGVPMP
ncbi:MAG: tripartite tricarboxylate transporter TctB family protein [Desulfovibrio sp.]|jgi:hypothetical protein|nr:tripartite tricarboxylate transporter TctB family protein [Desulfovibrio sp.]